MLLGSSKVEKIENIANLKRGVVKDLDDPEKLGRVKVMLTDETLETPLRLEA